METLQDIEHWRVVDGFEGFYEVSDYGRVRSVARKVKAKAGSMRHDPGRILKPFFNSGGYANVLLYRDTKRLQCRVHSLVAQAFIGQRPPAMMIHHKDFNKQNNCVENLSYVSRSQNVRFEFEASRCSRAGEKNPRHRLTNADVSEIRRLRLEGMNRGKLAEMFGITANHVWQIMSGRSWKRV